MTASAATGLAAEPFGRVLDGRNLLVCVGSGGVGKTTLAASIAVEAARRGRRVLVLTIDPARRLANALGLQRFGNDETPIDLEVLGGVAPGGALHAMMLDTKTTFTRVIERVSPDAATRDRILSNHVFQNIADSFAANQEYMATEQLYEVATSGRYDLVVLDTPPVKNALDFLDSPGRFARFLDRAIMKWFLTPYDESKMLGRILMGTSAVVFRLIGSIFGREFLADLSEFFLAFRDLYDGFRERQETVQRMFGDRATGFLIVAAPTEPSLEVAEYFLDELHNRGLPTVGVVMNRVHEAHHGEVDVDALLADRATALAAARGLDERVARSVVARLKMAHKRLVDVSVLEHARVGRLQQRPRRPAQLWTVPRQTSEVNDLPTLSRLAQVLFGAPET